MEHAPGKGFLKVSGILMIIFAAFGVLMGILVMVGGGLAGSLTSGTELDSVGGAVGGLVMILGLVTLIGAVFNLVMGILGVKYSDKPEKAQTCFILAIIAIAIQIVSAILGGAIWTLIIGLILPVLYLIGAIKNKNAVSSSGPSAS